MARTRAAASRRPCGPRLAPNEGLYPTHLALQRKSRRTLLDSHRPLSVKWEHSWPVGAPGLAAAGPGKGGAMAVRIVEYSDYL